METDQISQILSSIHIPINDPRFYIKVFTAVSKERKAAQARDGDNLKRVVAEEYDELSRRLDNTRVQESTSVRNVLRTRRLANLLINDKGELNAAMLPRVISHLTANLYSLGPQRQYDIPRQRHLLNVLTLLRDSKDLARLLKSINKPYLHPLADQIIRDTLLLPSTTVISDAHARRAALSAWMCYLRQNVGSCFATAPAIIVHDEQPETFLTDLRDLLGAGRMKRTFGGVEYSVPLNSSWGGGDLRKALLLSWSDTPEHSEIWNTPGLIFALEAVSLLDKDMPTKDKIKHTKELMLRAYPEWNESHPYQFTNMETIIKRILMQHIGITQQELDDYDHRPRGMIHSGLLMQISATGSSMGGKGEKCSHYHFQFEQACNAFKALADNALLKAWEFTIASFSETKSEFTRWNLYASLGLGPEEPHGIGYSMYEIIKMKLDQANQKMADIQFDYEHMFAQLKQMEVRMRSAGSETEAKWLRADYESQRNEFYTLEEMRDDLHAKAKIYANLFNFLMSTYDKLFPQYFQEVYDPDLHEVETGPFDDSPAGFRLLYKHGRANTSQWTKVTNPTEFQDALSNFFTSTEVEVAALPELEGLQSDISDIITSVVTQIKTKEFMESAFYRMAVAHKKPAIADPLENLEKIQAKPWAYISGGTMNTLLSCYYRREQKPTEVSRWVENPMELLVFFADTIKHVPPKATEGYLKDPNKGMLMHSPTHAFVLKPGVNGLKEAWTNEEFTHTWVRDALVRPRESFVENLNLDDYMMDYLIEQLTPMVPADYRHYFQKVFSHMHGPLNSSDFRYYIVERMDHERGLQIRGQPVLAPDDIDSTLYSLLPLFPAHQLKDRVKEILTKVHILITEVQNQVLSSLDELIDRLPGNQLITAQGLQDICNALICVGTGRTSLPQDVPMQVSKVAQQLGYAMPSPILVADTNWVKELFAFVVSPASGKLEFWRVDPIGRTGTPMSIWKEWLNGSRKDATWGLLTNPLEYTNK